MPLLTTKHILAATLLKSRATVTELSRVPRSQVSFQLSLEDIKSKQQTQGTSIERAIQARFFDVKSELESNTINGRWPVSLRTPCEMGVYCKQLIHNHRVYVNSLPGHMIISLGGGVELNKRTTTIPFDRMEFVAPRPGGREEKVRYNPTVAIFCVDKDHFITRRRRSAGARDVYEEDDGTRSRDWRKVSTWVSGLQAAKVVTIFLSQS